MASAKHLHDYAAGNTARLLHDLENAMNVALTEDPEAYATTFRILRDALADHASVAPPTLAPSLVTLREAVPTTENPTARDWAGFFAAILAFAKEIAPLIIPLLIPKA